MRWLPVSGILATVALAMTALLVPPPPIAGAPATDIVTYYLRHQSGLEAESVADGVGMMFLVTFAATFHARVRSVPSLTVLVAAGIVAACALGEVAAFHTLAYRPNPEPALAALLNDLQSFTFQVTTFPILLFPAAAGASILDSRGLPRWLGFAAVAAAVLQAVSWISFFAAPGRLAAGALPDIVAFASLLAWLVAASLVMLARPVARDG